MREQAQLTNPRDAMLCRPVKFGEDRMMRGRFIAYCRFSKWRPAVRHLFDIFAIFVKNSNLRLYLRRRTKFDEDRTMPGDCVFSIFKMAAVRHLGFGMTS